MTEQLRNFGDDFGELGASIMNPRAREVLQHWLKEFNSVPDQTIRETVEARRQLRQLFELAAGEKGDLLFEQPNSKKLADLTEIIQRLQEGNVAGAREMLFDEPNEIVK